MGPKGNNPNAAACLQKERRSQAAPQPPADRVTVALQWITVHIIMTTSSQERVNELPGHCPDFPNRNEGKLGQCPSGDRPSGLWRPAFFPDRAAILLALLLAEQASSQNTPIPTRFRRLRLELMDSERLAKR